MGLPTGPSVTFLFTDIEGSTRLERSAGASAWAGIVARHDRLLRDAIEGHGGVVVKTEGDAFFAAFARAADAAAGAVAAQRALAAEPWPDGVAIRVRMGLHVGDGRLREGRAPADPEDYVGIDVNYTARIAAAGNGGQIVVSDALSDALGAGLTDDVALVDDGLRAVKDFEEPVRLHRLVVPGAADDPRALRTIEPPSNLPGEMTPLVGRADEVASVRDALRESRVVTLTGPGGSGKTRLALGVAAGLADRFPHGTWFVDLAALRDALLLESTIATVLGIGETSGLAIGDTLRTHLRDRTLLFLLDNLEQLLPAAAETVARLVRESPGLRVLVTSRELLRIGGERGHPVPPLDLEAGATLFEARARSHRPDLVVSDDVRATIHAISERLGGLPLAIELAAARIRLLSPGQILQGLGHALDLRSGSRDAPERQRTLREAISWSHDLLTDDERRLFRRLAVFAGGWTLEALPGVVDPDGDAGVDLDAAFESLVDKSLVRSEPTATGDRSAEDDLRFGLHPLLREYGLERLEASGERPRIDAAHARWVVTMAQDVGPRILSAGGEASLHRLDHEQHNVRAAIDWARANDEPDVALRIVGSTWRWFQQRAYLRETRAVLVELLARPGRDPLARIAGLAAEGGIAYWMDDLAAAQAAYTERLALAEVTGDPGLTADGHYDLGFTAMVAGDTASLEVHEQRAVDLYVQAGMTDAATRARQALVLGVFQLGEYARAKALELENLAVFQERGSPFQVADSATFLAAVYMRLGDGETSWARLQEGLRIFSTNDSASGLARSLCMAAILQSILGDAEFGARIAGATYELAREKSVMLAPVKVLHLPDPGGLARERFGERRAAELLAEGAATPLAEMIERVVTAPPPPNAPDFVAV